jgi:hypothetical protein
MAPASTEPKKKYRLLKAMFFSLVNRTKVYQAAHMYGPTFGMRAATINGRRMETMRKLLASLAILGGMAISAVSPAMAQGYYYPDYYHHHHHYYYYRHHHHGRAVIIYHR